MLKLPWLILFISVVLNATGAFLIKRRLNDLGEFNIFPLLTGVKYCFHMARSPSAQIGTLFFIAAPILATSVFSRLDISVAYPAMAAMNMILVSLFAVVFLHEKMGFRWIVGVSLLIAGIFFLS